MNHKRVLSSCIRSYLKSWKLITSIFCCILVLMIISRKEIASPWVNLRNHKPVSMDTQRGDLQSPIHFATGFNLNLSDELSLHRHLPDVRHARCKTIKYTLADTAVSVIIVFYNEPLSTLLRTIYSVINRSKSEHLHELILVDDGSYLQLLQTVQTKISSDFSSRHIRVRAIRSEKNCGLIKARLTGAHSATGDVIVFLDSHCEVNSGWLEPLLDVIQKDRTRIACPIVDTISAETMEYEPIDGFRATGLFSWSLYFTWGRRRDSETSKVEEWQPFRTATFPGGLFAIDRKFFFEVGSYDEDMEGYGGENLEMSFRVWMCHGSIAFVPCSRVGHLSTGHDSVTESKSMDKNIKRLAEVWLDEYKRYFFLARPDLGELQIGNIDARIALRSELNCHNFSWYLANVCPGKIVPDANIQAWGTVRHQKSGLCITSTGFDEHEAFPFALQNCVNRGSTLYMLQVFSLGTDGHLRREDWCIGIEKTSSTPKPSRIRSYHCDEWDETNSETWSYGPNPVFRHVKSGKCLDTDGSQGLILAECTPERESQEFHFEHEL